MSKTTTKAAALLAKMAGKTKLPVPAPKPAQQAASAVDTLKAAQAKGGLAGLAATAILQDAKAKGKLDLPADLSIPPFLDRSKNGVKPASAQPVPQGKAMLRALAASASVPVTKVPQGMTAAKLAAIAEAKQSTPIPAMKGKGKAAQAKREEAISAAARKGSPKPASKPASDAAKSPAKPASKAKGGRKPKDTPEGKITVLAKENPKRGGAAERFSLYKTGMATADYIKAAMRKGASESYAKADLRWDISHGWIKVA